ncbi:MAG: hypothetical protein MJ093_02935 [Saccharofermentans sp.]|nr:hypothetical protein [Saccharofermentans sp.]
MNNLLLLLLDSGFYNPNTADPTPVVQTIEFPTLYFIVLLFSGILSIFLLLLMVKTMQAIINIEQELKTMNNRENQRFIYDYPEQVKKHILNK